MSLDAGQKQLLRAALAKRSRGDLKALFAAIRGNDDRALLSALAMPKKKPRRASDPLLRNVDQILKPLMAPGAEKAEMLVEHIAKKHRRKLAASPTGLADAIRRLRAAKLSDEQILAGAKSLMAALAKLHGRETVV
ncbi:MAG: hypothetical protein JSS00_07415 [Proteobacteria bacterium]|nr:hypothetical protein [Pseudomonadota bacterium]